MNLPDKLPLTPSQAAWLSLEEPASVMGISRRFGWRYGKAHLWMDELSRLNLIQKVGIEKTRTRTAIIWGQSK